MSVLDIIEIVFGLSLGTALFLLVFSVDDKNSKRNK